MAFKFDSSKEALLKPDTKRFTMYPLEHPDIWALAKKAQSALWVAESLDFHRDLDHWKNKLTDNERFFIKNVLAFFAASDGIVNENLALNFYSELQSSEARFLYSVQIYMEGVHCVAPNTKILTDKGYHTIKDLENEEVNVWNGYEFSNVTVIKTSENDQLYRVTLSNGIELECTSKHKWHINSKTGLGENKNDKKIIYTIDLEIGETIISDWIYPILDISNENTIFKDPYKMGFECYTSNEMEKLVPINESVIIKLKWFEGYIDSGFEYDIIICEFIQILYEDRSFLKNIQLMLSTLGMHTYVSEEYNKSGSYILFIPYRDTTLLCNLGFNPKNVDMKKMTKTYNTSNIISVNSTKYSRKDIPITISSVTKLTELSDTYCFNEPKNHTGIFNGMLTGQSETYSLLIDTYITNPDEKADLFNALETNPIVKKKAEWAMKWFDTKTKSFPERLIAFGVVEGVFFSGSFAAIFWLKSRKLMPVLTESNKYISKDESLHCETCVLFYNKLEQKLPESTVHDIFRDAYLIEEEFITQSLPVSLLGMNSQKMKEHIKYTVDYWLIRLGYSRLFNVLTDPLEKIMESGNFLSKQNMFEGHVDSYAEFGVGGDPTENKIVFDMIV